MKNFITVIFLIAVVFILFISYLAIFNPEINMESYSSMRQVKSAKAIQRGWIPSSLPESSFGIRVSYNLDLNTGNGEYYFKNKKEGKKKLLRAIKLVSINGNTPDDFIKLEKMGYKFYKEGYFLVAINIRNNHGRFWIMKDFNVE
jgi:hypothetical protein